MLMWLTVSTNTVKHVTLYDMDNHMLCIYLKKMISRKGVSHRCMLSVSNSKPDIHFYNFVYGYMPCVFCFAHINTFNIHTQKNENLNVQSVFMLLSFKFHSVLTQRHIIRHDFNIT